MRTIPCEFAEKHPVATFALAHPFITLLIVDELACHAYNAYNHTIELKYGNEAAERKKGFIGTMVSSTTESLKKTNDKLEEEINEEA